MLNKQQEVAISRTIFCQPENMPLKAALALERNDWPGVLELTLGCMDSAMSSKIIVAAILTDYERALNALTNLFRSGSRPKDIIACGLAGTILGLFEGVQEFHLQYKPHLQDKSRFESYSIWVVAEIVVSRQSFMTGFDKTIGKADMSSIDGAVKFWARDDSSRCRKLADILKDIDGRDKIENKDKISDFGKVLLRSMAFGAMTYWDSMKLFTMVASSIANPWSAEAETARVHPDSSKRANE